MSNRPEVQGLLHHSPKPHTSEERVEDYLEHLVAPLVGLVPYRERKAFRQEAHVHIEGLIQGYLLEGQTLPEATETALREFGEPWKVGQAFVQEWQQGEGSTRPDILRRNATLTAFAWFGMASMGILLALEQSLLNSADSGMLPVVGFLAFLAPFVAGSLTGAMSPAQAEQGTRNALLLLILHSFVTSLLLLPRYEGMIFAVWQLLFWLPCGRVSAGLTATYLRNLQRQRFWRIAR